MGMGFAMFAVGALIAGPGAGGILERHGEDQLDWSGVFAFGATCTAVATVGFVVVRIIRAGLGLNKV